MTEQIKKYLDGLNKLIADIEAKADNELSKAFLEGLKQARKWARYILIMEIDENDQ